MPMEIFFENEATKTRFKVLKFNKEEGTVTMIGKHNREFTEPFSKERFERMGYKPIQINTDDLPPPPPPVPQAVVA